MPQLPHAYELDLACTFVNWFYLHLIIIGKSLKSSSTSENIITSNIRIAYSIFKRRSWINLQLEHGISMKIWSFTLPTSITPKNPLIFDLIYSYFLEVPVDVDRLYLVLFSFRNFRTSEPRLTSFPMVFSTGINTPKKWQTRLRREETAKGIYGLYCRHSLILYTYTGIKVPSTYIIGKMRCR